MNQPYTFTITGRPITKKNSMRRTKNSLMQSRQYAAYEESALWQLKVRHKENTIDCPVIMTALYYMPNRKSWPDLIGLLQATCDILEKAAILANDRLVVGFGDSRIAGIDKQNPHVDIGIEIVPTDGIAYTLDPYVLKHGSRA